MKNNNQKGFTLVQAVFILVVLGLLGMVMVRLIGVQTSTGVMALQGARAYHAARSGLEWGAARASRVDPTVDPCVLIDDPICTTADLDGLSPFKVDVSCSCRQFTEGSIDPYNIYSIYATATFGSPGTVDYVSRKVQMKVGTP
jgi:MSHA biogenesis protein MshP